MISLGLLDFKSVYFGEVGAGKVAKSPGLVIWDL